MVIIGGAGSLWGAIIGAAIVRALDRYLNELSTSSFVAHLPTWLHQTLGQPLLLFGCIYLVLVYFFPQGIAGLVLKYKAQLGGKDPSHSSPFPRTSLQPKVGEQ
jgi:branched-chain amino acid transport system permease protein